MFVDLIIFHVLYIIYFNKIYKVFSSICKFLAKLYHNLTNFITLRTL